MNKGGTTGEYTLVLDVKDGDFLRAGKDCQRPQNKVDGCLHPECLICGHWQAARDRDGVKRNRGACRQGLPVPA